MSSNTDSDKTQWFHDLLTWETEGEISPAQSDREPPYSWDEYNLPGLLKPQFG